jgi:acyl-CoA reductase-like NAD-dependent aldehyde dehydrogenase
MMEEIVSTNPATLEEVGRVPATSPAKVRERVAAARAASPIWRRKSFKKRGKYLLRARKFLLDNIDEFAETITIDNGKPLTEALTAEIYPIAELLYHFAHNTESTLEDSTLPIGVMKFLRRRSTVSFEPMGVVGIISPWNYPFSIAVGEVAMALICGNTVLLKPSSETPLVGKIIEEMWDATGLPQDVFSHLPGNSETGEALVKSNVDKIFFTGSVGVGKRVMAACAENVTPLVLELGGKDPMIVRADADLDVATSGAVWGAFTNAGQCCASVERVYVHESIFDEFVELCVRKALKLRIGNGLDPDVDVGAITTQSQLEHIEAQMLEASERGATIHCGGRPITDRRGRFYPPTVLTGIDHSFSCIRDETFGPTMPVMSFTDDKQAVRLANDSAFGLTASIWTKNIVEGQKIARNIEAGTIMINDCVFTHALPGTPWGGCKHSGFGRSHSCFGLHEMITPHHIHTNRIIAKDMWWYGYNMKVFRSFSVLAKTLTGGFLKQIGGFSDFLNLWRRKKL